jgi:Toprim domain
MLVHCHGGCEQADVIEALKALGLWEGAERTFIPLKRKPKAEPATDNRGKARWAWHRSLPIQRTAAEVYLRRERGILCVFPETLRFLPGTDRHPPSMIAPFAMADEFEPGSLSVKANQVGAVHITRLTPDGHKHPAEPNKIMLGSATGMPIVVAPPNDLLGLVITEGIEDGLSVFEATGSGVWVAGCAARMPGLAVAIPSWVECVTICADDDEPGRKNAYALAELLDQRGGFEIKVEGLP